LGELAGTHIDVIGQDVMRTDKVAEVNYTGTFPFLVISFDEFINNDSKCIFDHSAIASYIAR